MQWSERVEEAEGLKVKQEISTPHDKLFNQLLGEPENAASFLANNLAAEIVSHLDLTTLQVVHVSFIDTQFIQSEADLLFSVTIANRPGYVYFLFEHQSSPDGFMILRLLSYMVRVWKRFQREDPRCDLLPVIVPMVLFHGPRGWQGPLSFRSLVDIPDKDFLPYIPDFLCRLFDLSPFGKDQLAGNALVRILGDLLGAFGRPDFEERVRRADSSRDRLHRPSSRKACSPWPNGCGGSTSLCPHLLWQTRESHRGPREMQPHLLLTQQGRRRSRATGFRPTLPAPSSCARCSLLLPDLFSQIELPPCKIIMSERSTWQDSPCKT